VVETDEIRSSGLFAPDAPDERVGGADRVLVSVDPHAEKKSEPVRENNKPTKAGDTYDKSNTKNTDGDNVRGHAASGVPRR
jgi:hypothetical protein